MNKTYQILSHHKFWFCHWPHITIIATGRGIKKAVAFSYFWGHFKGGRKLVSAYNYCPSCQLLKHQQVLVCMLGAYYIIIVLSFFPDTPHLKLMSQSLRLWKAPLVPTYSTHSDGTIKFSHTRKSLQGKKLSSIVHIISGIFEKLKLTHL